MKCESKNHIENIEEYNMNVMEAMENAGLECLPTSGGGNVQGKRPNIPGWNEHIKPYGEESNLYFSSKHLIKIVLSHKK